MEGARDCVVPALLQSLRGGLDSLGEDLAPVSRQALPPSLDHHLTLGP